MSKKGKKKSKKKLPTWWKSSLSWKSTS